MILYLLKVIFCTAFMLGIYLSLLEREKNHWFKRFFLLSALIVPIVIPLISLKMQSQKGMQHSEIFLNVSPNLIALKNHAVVQSRHFNTSDLFYIIYGLVTAFMLLKFCKSIFKIFLSIKENEKVITEKYTIVLIPGLKTIYSFLNYIFLDQEDYMNNRVEEQIFSHEQAHVKQRHTLDVLLSELLKVIFWFNPFIFFLKKSIQTNHEYLADEFVIRIHNNITLYQMILFQKIRNNQILNLTSSFNYLTTKKRLIMMTRTTSKKAELFKQFAIIPLTAFAIFLFSTRTDAQENAVKTNPIKAPDLKNSISEKEFTEYNNICNKYRNVNKKGYVLYDGFSDQDRNRLQTLFLKMSRAQQLLVAVHFSPAPKNPLPKISPTKEQFEKFKNASEYGIWIDNKKVSNEELSNYSCNDFDQVFISKLYGTAKKNAAYNYQVDLMTKEYYRNYVKQHAASLKENQYTILSKVTKATK